MECDPNIELLFKNSFPDLSNGDARQMLEFTPAGLGIIKDRVVQWSNQALCSMLGYEPGFLTGKNTKIFYEDLKEYDRIGRELYSRIGKNHTAITETRLLKKDGNLLNCRIRASLLCPGDESKGFVFVITDISELKMLQIQLHQAEKMDAIGVLAGGVSHDFNNILMGIQGHLSLMQINYTNPEKVSGHVKQIEKLVKTASDLTKRLLGFARGGKYKISLLDINELIYLALNIFEPTRKDIVIHKNCDENLRLIDGDHSQLEQVFMNLLINASQAMPGDGDIYITTSNITIGKDHNYPFTVIPGHYVKATVRDTGIGMDLDTQRKIFDPFFSTKTTVDQKGRGLGLSTVYGIVKHHEGFIVVDSVKGKGASFHVCLPASRKSRQKDILEKTPEIKTLLKGSETVLLVDDEPEFINIGKNFLEKLGYTSVVALNGLEAVEIFKIYKDRISLVVLDIVMPEMNGPEAFMEIKKIKKDVKVLVSTGYAVDDRIEDLLKKGCDDYIRKPFSLNEFSHALRKILDKP